MKQALAVEGQIIQDEDKIVTSVNGLCEAAKYMKVGSQEDLSNATDLVKLIKTRHREIDAERTSLVKPLNDTVDKINGRFKVILAPLKTAEDFIKANMLTFEHEKNRKAEQARRGAEEAARKAAEETAKLATEPQLPVETVVPGWVPPVLPVVPAKPTYGAYGSTSSLKKTWAFELVDISALAAARPDLLMVDEVKVNAEIRGKGGEIPGLRIFQKETIAVR